jgi:hypothetical protein
MTEHTSEHHSPHGTPPVSEAGEPDAVVVVAAGRVAHGERTDRVVSWVGWHLGELAGVGVPTVLAATVHPWWTVPAVVVALGWVAHEVRLSRRVKALRTGAAAHSAPAGQVDERTDGASTVAAPKGGDVA